MVVESKTKAANFLYILSILRDLQDQGAITDAEFERAKLFYQNLTGSKIYIAG